jgi:hypothetical protein
MKGDKKKTERKTKRHFFYSAENKRRETKRHMIVLPPVKVTTPPMSPTKSNMHPLQIVSQGYAHLPTRHIQKTPNRDSGAPRFDVYGFDLLDRIGFVSTVMSLVVPYLFGCVSSTILVVPLYISLCMYHLSKRHISQPSVFIIVSSFHLYPPDLVFFYSDVNQLI